MNNNKGFMQVAVIFLFLATSIGLLFVSARKTRGVQNDLYKYIRNSSDIIEQSTDKELSKNDKTLLISNINTVTHYLEKKGLIDKLLHTQDIRGVRYKDTAEGYQHITGTLDIDSLMNLKNRYYFAESPGDEWGDTIFLYGIHIPADKLSFSFEGESKTYNGLVILNNNNKLNVYMNEEKIGTIIKKSSNWYFEDISDSNFRKIKFDM